jgi:hypothetical protein
LSKLRPSLPQQIGLSLRVENSICGIFDCQPAAGVIDRAMKKNTVLLWVTIGFFWGPALQFLAAGTFVIY